MHEIVEQLAATVRHAAAEGAPLCIRGGGTKDFYGGAPRGTPLALTAYRGVVDYEPSELVLTARAGTPIAEIEAALAERGQMLAFEPPRFDARPDVPPTPGGTSSPSALTPLPQAGEGNVVPAAPVNTRGTLGGCVAAGLSGPRRVAAGSVRDFVLGVRMLDGRGNDLRFGGQVMKNVAGFDVSRLMAGSLGTLGVLLEVSLKVLPSPAVETTLRLEKTAAETIALVNAWAGQPLPVSATAWCAGELSVRLSGAAAAVDAAAAKLGGDRVESSSALGFWRGVRDHTDAFFRTRDPVWRLSIRPTAPPLELPGAQLIEWGGALRWIAADVEVQAVRSAARSAGGHATLFRGGDKSVGVFQPLSPALMTIHRNLKRALDPAGIFNPGRMYDI